MSEPNQPNEDAALQAPAELAEDLRRSQKKMLLVPPQIDAAALSRPRLHLAHIRDLRAHGRATPTAPTEDLALAARASADEERLAGKLAPRGKEEPMSSGGRSWNLILWLAAGVAALAMCFLLRWLLVR